MPRPSGLSPLAFLPPILAAALIAGALLGSGFDPAVSGASQVADIQRLGQVSVDVPPSGPPVLTAEIGRRARGQVLLWREQAPGSYVTVARRKAGLLKPPEARIPLGSGHVSEGSLPGRVLTTSRMVHFELPAPRAGLPAGRYGVELQLRSH